MMTVSSKTTPTPAPTQLIIRDKSTLSVGVCRGSDSSDIVVMVSVVQGYRPGEVGDGGVLGLHKISSHGITEICQFGCFRVFKIATLQHRVLSVFSFCPQIS